MNTGAVTWNNRIFSLQLNDEVLFKYMRGTEATFGEMNGITRTIQEMPVGVIDGSNKVFILPHSPVNNDSVITFLNAAYQSQGSTEEYIIVDKTITFKDAPLVGDVVWVQYDIFNALIEKVQEKPVGECDGINRIFLLSEMPVTYSSVMLYLGGAFLSQGFELDYTILGKKIELEDPPADGSQLWVVYEKNVSSVLTASPQMARTVQEIPDGDLNGINTEFLLSQTPVNNQSVVVYLNAAFQSQGPSEDYVIANNLITFVTPPTDTDIVWVSYTVSEFTTTRVQEIPGGDIDGFNDEFTLSYMPFNTDSITVYSNGMYLAPGVTHDYTISNQTIIFNTPPSIGTKLWILYERSSQSFSIEGSSIINVGDADPSIQDLIDQREYEENLNVRIKSYANTSEDYYYPIQFSTKKRVVPTVIFTDVSKTNVDSATASGVTVNGFNIKVNATASGVFDYSFTWQAQCASYTKFMTFKSNDFVVVSGAPILDKNNKPTGEYSKAKTKVKYTDIIVDKDNESLLIKIGLNSIFVPVTNEEQIIKILYGLNSDHLAAQSLKLVKKILTDTEYQELQRKLRSKNSVKQELKKVYLEKRKELLEKTKKVISQKQVNELKNETLVLQKIEEGQTFLK